MSKNPMEDLLDRAAKELARISQGCDSSHPARRPCCHEPHHRPHGDGCEASKLIEEIKELIG